MPNLKTRSEKLLIRLAISTKFLLVCVARSLVSSSKACIRIVEEIGPELGLDEVG